MRSRTAVASALAASFVFAFAFAGCALSADHGADSEETDEAGNALSKTAPELVDAYNLQAGSTGDFSHLVLKADGSYFAETTIECFRAPCIDPRTVGTWRSTDFTHTTLGTLSLRPAGSASVKYKVSLAGDGSGMKLSRGGVISRFDKVLNFCDDGSDCAGQPVRALGIMCMKGDAYHTVCATGSHSCITKCMSTTPCEVTRCGIGCADHMEVCTLMLKAGVKECYASTGKCDRDESGACAWLDQPQIDVCLAKLP